MKISFKRITSTGNFIPEIDGLRFIAIISVVLYHLHGFLSTKDLSIYSDNLNYDFVKNIIARGHLGVPLFFVISGFILGFPFAKESLLKEGTINLKNYFFRRLTRLEPPYILIMTVLLFGSVYVAKSVTFEQGIVSYFASLFYIHNLVFPKISPLLNSPAWSLEVEVQFYIIAPIMAKLFIVNSPKYRRPIMVILIVLFTILNHLYNLPFVSLIGFFQYFLIGFLLADFYVTKTYILSKTKYDSLIGIVAFCLIWVYDVNESGLLIKKILISLLHIASIFLFYYYALFHKTFKVLSVRWVTDIGGMCYSIYLLHYPIISLFGNRLVKLSFSDYSFINLSIYAAILISVILILSSAFYLLVEKPCMNKYWFQNLFKSDKVTRSVKI